MRGRKSKNKNRILLTAFGANIVVYMLCVLGLESTEHWPRWGCLISGTYLILFLWANKDCWTGEVGRFLVRANKKGQHPRNAILKKGTLGKKSTYIISQRRKKVK